MADPLRPRRTRVKTGCLCCRLRRKKCDEQKPLCSGCKRNSLICSWPSNPAPSSSGQGQSSDLGWRSQLVSGQRVSRTREDLSKRVSETDSSNCTEIIKQPSTIEQPKNSRLANQLRFPEMFGTASLKNPLSRILFEHYVNETSQLLSAIRGPENPFITCVLPLARSDPMIMDCVLAISGSHLGCTTTGSDIELAASTHYALALRQFKHTLTKTVSGKVSKPVNLLLTALMLCNVESISGNSQGAMFHHLRASSQFVRLMLALKPDQVGHELSGFLLEMYAYLVSVANITANTDSDYHTVIFDPYTDALQEFRDSKVYGALLGCAQDLFELIPSICKFGYRRLAGESEKECSFETVALYKSLESKIKSWHTPQIILGDQYSVNDQVIAAKVYQQASLIFLHANFYGSNVLDPVFLDLVNTSIETVLPVVGFLPEDSPIMATLLWPCMIIGSCLCHSELRSLLRYRMLASPYNMILVSKAVQLLDWLWEDDDSHAYGPYGLGVVMKKHKITYCMG